MGRSLLPLALVASAGAACIPVYIAPPANAPLFTEPLEFQAAVHYDLLGVNGQLAFAPMDGLGIIADGQFKTGVRERQAVGSGGVGYWTAFSRKGRFEAFAGGGGGSSSAKIEFEDTTGAIQTAVASGSYGRGFVQADVGLATDIVDLGGSLRVSVVAYTFDQHPLGVTSSVGAFLEPTFFIRAGYKWVKAELQGNMVLPMTVSETPPEMPNQDLHGLDTRWFQVSFGLRFFWGGFSDYVDSVFGPAPDEPKKRKRRRRRRRDRDDDYYEPAAPPPDYEEGLPPPQPDPKPQREEIFDDAEEEKAPREEIFEDLEDEEETEI